MHRLSRLALAVLVPLAASMILAACDGSGQNIRCALTSIPNGIQVGVADPIDGLRSIVSGPGTSNAHVAIPTFAVGTKAQVTVTATKVTAGPSVVDLRVTDAAPLPGTKQCDPVAFTVVRGTDNAVTVPGVANTEHVVTFKNGTPGLRRVVVDVDRTKYHVTLKPGQRRDVDVGGAMHSGANTLTFTARGARDGSTDVVIWDGKGGLATASAPLIIPGTVGAPAIG